jgi:hypothetical protein
VTYDDATDAHNGIRPIYQFDFASGVKSLEEKQATVRERIQRVFGADIFRLFMDSDRREQTAAEVAAKKDEQLLQLGPFLWQFDGDVGKPLIERGYNMLQRKGLLPDPPQELIGVELHAEFISIVAQALKAAGLPGLERFSSFANQIAATQPDVLDWVDDGELIEEYAEEVGIPPKIVRSKESVQQMRAARAKQAAQQQAAENAPKLAGAAKDLSQAPTPDGGNALAMLLQKSRARAQLDATAQHSASVLP